MQNLRHGDRYWCACIVVVLAALLLATPTGAADIRTLDDRGRDQGTIGETRSESLDIFDAHGRRLGYCVRRSDGSTDYFRPDGSRMGYSQPGRSGHPDRLTLQPRKR